MSSTHLLHPSSTLFQLLSNYQLQAVSLSSDPTSTEHQTRMRGGHVPSHNVVKHAQPVALTTVLNDVTPSNAVSYQELGPTQNLPSRNGRRRDYTKEEKEAFEHWITNNPNPNRAQRVRYAQINGLVKSQVDNLINNRKRDLRRAEKEIEQAELIVNTAGDPATRPGEDPFRDDLFPLQSEPCDHENDIIMLSDSKLHYKAILYSHCALG